jgi:hypothetical protein
VAFPPGIEKRHGGMKVHGLAGQLAQLASRVLVAAGLVVAPRAAGGDLVGSDDELAARRQRACLGEERRSAVSPGAC